MRVYRVGIIGHKAHQFKNQEEVRRLCSSTTLLLMDQYVPNSLCVNTTAAPGTGQWVGETCLENGINHHIFLPCAAETYSREWYDRQRLDFNAQLDDCYGITVIGSDLSKDSICNASKALVDNSDFIVCFWEGARYGLTFETIKYAIESSKIVLDGMDYLSLVSKSRLAPRKHSDDAPYDIPVRRVEFRNNVIAGED